MSNSTSFLKVLLLCALILYGIIPLSAQIYASSNIQTQSIANTTLSLKQVLDQLETKYRITISYKSDIVTNRNVLWNDYASSSIDGDLKAILDPFNLIYKKIGNTAYVIIDTNIGTYKNDDAIDANNTPTAGDALLSLDFNNVQLSKLIEVIEAQTDYKFSFDQSVIDANTLVSIKEQNATLDLILSKISEQMDIKFMRQSLEIFIQEKADIKNNWVEANNIYRDLSKEISGRIIDNSGEALPGVNIIVKGTSIGTTTDINGYYKLDVPDDATLVVTFIGYITQTIQVGAKNIIDIILRPDTKELDEVVVVGYGEQRKSDLTGAVASLGEKNFNKGANVAVEQLLAGRVAGVQMTQSNGEPGGGFAMRIRGSSSITASNDPLYVIDGFPM